MGAVRGGPPDERGAAGALGSVVGRLNAGGGDERPEGRRERDQGAAGVGGLLIWRQPALVEPIAQMSLNGREGGQEGRIGQGSVRPVWPQDQHLLGVQFEVEAAALGVVAAFQDFLEIAPEMAPAQLALRGASQW